MNCIIKPISLNRHVYILVQVFNSMLFAGRTTQQARVSAGSHKLMGTNILGRYDSNIKSLYLAHATFKSLVTFQIVLM